MIESFADQGTQDIYDGTTSRAARQTLPQQLWRIAQRKMDLINAAAEVRDLSVPPGNRLEQLQGDLAGLWSIRINDQFRIVFAFGGGKAQGVKITDYH